MNVIAYPFTSVGEEWPQRSDEVSNEHQRRVGDVLAHLYVLTSKNVELLGLTEGFLGFNSSSKQASLMMSLHILLPGFLGDVMGLELSCGE